MPGIVTSPDLVGIALHYLHPPFMGARRTQPRVI